MGKQTRPKGRKEGSVNRVIRDDESASNAQELHSQLLPDDLINRIIELSWKSIDHCSCIYPFFYTTPSQSPNTTTTTTTTNNNNKKKKNYKKDHYEDDEDEDDNYYLDTTENDSLNLYKPYKRLHYFNQLKKYNQSCPLHSLYNDNYYNNYMGESKVYESSTSRDSTTSYYTYYSEHRDKYRWRLQLATISRKVMEYVQSNLFTSVNFGVSSGDPQPTSPTTNEKDIHNHLKNNYCMIKNIKTMSISAIQEYNRLFGIPHENAKRMKQPWRSPSVTIYKNVKKLILGCDSKPTVPRTYVSVMSHVTVLVFSGSITSNTELIPLVKTFHSLASLNLIDVPKVENQSVLTGLLKNIVQPLRKLLLPIGYSNQIYQLSDNAKKSLKIISLPSIVQNEGEEKEHQQNLVEQFPNIKQLYITSTSSSSTPSSSSHIILPIAIKKITFFNILPIEQFITTNDHLRIVRVKFNNNHIQPSKFIDYIPKELGSIDTLIIDWSQVLSTGDYNTIQHRLTYCSSALKHTSNGDKRKLIFKRKMDVANDPQMKRDIGPLTLPNIIVYKIMKECWDSYLIRHCTCTRILNWENQDKWSNFLPVLKEYKENAEHCPEHCFYSNIQASKLKNKQLQLLLINSQIFSYLKNHVQYQYLMQKNYETLHPMFIDGKYSLFNRITDLDLHFLEIYETKAFREMFQKLSGQLLRFNGKKFPRLEPFETDSSKKDQNNNNNKNKNTNNISLPLTHFTLQYFDSYSTLVSHTFFLFNSLVSINFIMTPVRFNLDLTVGMFETSFPNLKKLLFHQNDLGYYTQLSTKLKQQLESMSWLVTSNNISEIRYLDEFINIRKLYLRGTTTRQFTLPTRISKIVFFPRSQLVAQYIIQGILVMNPHITTIKKACSYGISLDSCLQSVYGYPSTLQTIIETMWSMYDHPIIAPPIIENKNSYDQYPFEYLGCISRITNSHITKKYIFKRKKVPTVI